MCQLQGRSVAGSSAELDVFTVFMMLDRFNDFVILQMLQLWRAEF